MTDLWLALNSVHRWHSGPSAPALAPKLQTNAQHSGSMAALALELWPDCSRALLVGCILHDAPEYFTGDMPQGAKDNIVVKYAMDTVEARAADENGWTFALDDLDARRLKFLDRLEAYAFADQHASQIMDDNGWPEARIWLRSEAARLGLEVTL